MNAGRVSKPRPYNLDMDQATVYLLIVISFGFTWWWIPKERALGWFRRLSRSRRRSPETNGSVSFPSRGEIRLPSSAFR